MNDDPGIGPLLFIVLIVPAIAWLVFPFVVMSRLKDMNRQLDRMLNLIGQIRVPQNCFRHQHLQSCHHHRYHPLLLNQILCQKPLHQRACARFVQMRSPLSLRVRVKKSPARIVEWKLSFISCQRFDGLA